MKRHHDQPGARGACLSDLIKELSVVVAAGGTDAPVYLIHPNRPAYPLTTVVSRSIEASLVELDGLFESGTPLTARVAAVSLAKKRQNYGECDVMIYHWGHHEVVDVDGCMVSFLEYDQVANRVYIASHISEKANAIPA